MKALFFGVVTLFLIVGMSNDAQAACNAVCQAKYRATHHGGLTYEQCVAKLPKLVNENPAEEARRIAQKNACLRLQCRDQGLNCNRNEP
jgi:hypothetical protein